jgi:hypothetical protein
MKKLIYSKAIKKAMIITILIAIGFSSCISFIGTFHNPYPNNSGGAKIKTNGYYYYSNPDDRDSSLCEINPIVFYDDGRLYKGWWTDCKKDVPDSCNIQNQPAHPELINRWLTGKDFKKKRKASCEGWGRYFVKNDTVIIEYLQFSGKEIVFSQNNLKVGSLSLKIVNDSTLFLKNDWGGIIETYYFRKSEVKPNPEIVRKILKRNYKKRR